MAPTARATDRYGPAVLAEHRYDLVAPPDAPAAVLVLHPHPDMGGTRHDPVVDAVFRGAAHRGWAAVRVDFSSSELDTARGEAREALELLPPTPTTGVVGYSFGAAVAAGLDHERLGAWVLVAAPFGGRFRAAGSAAGADERPTLLLSPAHDQFCPPDAARAATDGWVGTVVEPVPGTDHFLAGALDAVAARSLDWVAGTL